MSETLAPYGDLRAAAKLRAILVSMGGANMLFTTVPERDLRPPVPVPSYVVDATGILYYPRSDSYDSFYRVMLTPQGDPLPKYVDVPEGMAVSFFETVME